MNILQSKHTPQTARSSESNKGIYDFLKSHPIGVLATVDPNHNPHAVVIYFSVDEEFMITFITKRGTKKSDNIERANHVMLVAYEASSQTTAQITGLAEEIVDAVAAKKAFKNMLQAAEQTSESGDPPITKLYAGQYIAYRIKPIQIRMAVFIRPDPGGYDMYETIEFEH